jgi:rod shape-determining protein MreD
MPVARAALAAVLVFIALVVQLSLLSRLPLPGATPDLLLVTVVALALVDGPLAGALTGFGAGLALDLAPPADHAIGRWALVLCVVGYLVGLVGDDVDRSAFAPFAVVAAAAAGTVLLYAGLGALLDDPRIVALDVVKIIPTAVLYDVVLAPFVVFVVTAMTRRFAPEPTSW